MVGAASLYVAGIGPGVVQRSLHSFCRGPLSLVLFFSCLRGLGWFRGASIPSAGVH